MLINERYKLFKKDVNWLDNYYFITIYDVQKKYFFTITHKCKYIGYSIKEIINKAFDIFVKILKDDFDSFYERINFINKNNLEFEFN